MIIPILVHIKSPNQYSDQEWSTYITNIIITAELEALDAGTMNRVGSAESSKEEHNPSHHGPIKNRGCTDIICLLIFLAFCVGWAVIGIYGFANGDPRILIYPSDSDGKICGKEDFVDKPNLFFFDITKCLRASAGKKNFQIDIFIYISGCYHFCQL